MTGENFFTELCMPCRAFLGRWEFPSTDIGHLRYMQDLHWRCGYCSFPRGGLPLCDMYNLGSTGRPWFSWRISARDPLGVENARWD